MSSESADLEADVQGRPAVESSASSGPSDTVFTSDDETNRRLVETFPGGLVQVALDGSIVQANVLAQQILGLSYSELARRYVADFKTETIWEDGSPCDPEDYPVSKCLKTAAAQPCVTIGVRKPDGQISWGLYSAMPILDSQTRQMTGAIVRFVDFTRRKQSELELQTLKQQLEYLVDERTVSLGQAVESLAKANEKLQAEIAERRLVEAQLRESQRFSQGLAEAAPYVLYVYDLSLQQTVFANQQAARVLGYTPAELQKLGPRMAETVVHQDWQQPLKEHFERVSNARDGEVHEFEYVAVRADGSERWLRSRDVVFARTPDGRTRQVIGTAEDITDYKLAVAAEQKSSAQLRFITEHAPDVILELDRQGMIRFVNRTLPPDTPDDVVGTSFRHWIPQGDYERFLQIVARVFDTGSNERYEISSRAPDGSERWYACHIGPILVDGAVHSAVVVARDITERKAADQRLVAKQQLLKNLLAIQERERKLIAAEIHDGLMQDVTGAKMLLEGTRHQLEAIAGGPLKSLDRVEELLGKAIGEGRRMISDLRPLEIDEQGIAESIRSLVEEESRRTGLEINFVEDVQFDRLDPLMEGTLFRIAQEALTNVRRHSQARRVNIRLVECDQDLLLEIEDDGVGFDPETVSEDRFGVRGMIQRARLFGGTAAITSSPGHGTKIRVELPLS